MSLQNFFSRSSTAQRLNIDNSVPRDIFPNCVFTWDKLRSILAPTFIDSRDYFVSSFYRCPALNNAVGGVLGSEHTRGLAVDICPVSSAVAEKILHLFSEYVTTHPHVLRYYKYNPRKGYIHVSFFKSPKNE